MPISFQHKCSQPVLDTVENSLVDLSVFAVLHLKLHWWSEHRSLEPWLLLTGDSGRRGNLPRSSDCFEYQTGTVWRRTAPPAIRRKKTDQYNDLHASVTTVVEYIKWGIMDYISGWALLILCHTALQVEWQVVAFHKNPLPELFFEWSDFWLDPREVQFLYADRFRYLKGTSIDIQNILQSI